MVIAAQNRLRGLQRETSSKHCQLPEAGLTSGVQEVVAPGDGVAHSLVAERDIARAIAQHGERMREPIQKGIRRQRCGASGGQLDGERDAVEPIADGVDGLTSLVIPIVGIHRLGAAGEESAGIDLVEGVQRVDLLASEMKAGPAGGECLQVGMTLQETGEQWAGREQVFEIVEQHQEVPVAERNVKGIVRGERGKFPFATNEAGKWPWEAMDAGSCWWVGWCVTHRPFLAVAGMRLDTTWEITLLILPVRALFVNWVGGWSEKIATLALLMRRSCRASCVVPRS